MMLLLVSLGVLFAGALLAVLLAKTPRAGLLLALAAIVLAGILSLTSATGELLGPGGVHPQIFGWPMPIGMATLSMDSLSAWFVLVISLLSISAAIYSWGYMRGHDLGTMPAFSAFLCVLVAALLVVVCAGDVATFLVSWEAMTLAAFFLVGLHDAQEDVRHGAWMYLIATHLGTALCLLPMFALLVSRGGLQFSSISAAMSSADPDLCIIIFLLGVVGFGTKAGFVPMHVWLPRAHPVAPTPVSALLSGVVVKTGIYGLIRLLTWLPPLPGWCAGVLLIIGGFGGVLGVLYALAQHDLKRLLAYHTVENIGIILLGIGIGMIGQRTGHPFIAALGYAGALLHVLNHALFKGLLFLSAGAVIHSTGTGSIDELGGLAKKTPWNARLFLTAALSICGLPPFNGFISEWLIYAALFGGAIQLAAPLAAASIASLTALALMGGLALACFAKVFSVVFLGEPRHPREVHSTPLPMLAGMILPAILCILIGIVPIAAVPLLAGPIGRIVPLRADQFGIAVDRSLELAAALSAFFIIFAAIVCILLVLRRRAAATQAIVPATAGRPTWGCGYAAPTSRMQYTASSFAWSLILGFRSLLWPQRNVEEPKGCFPAPGHLHSEAQDIAESDIFAPIFRGITHLMNMVKTLSWTGQASAAESPAEHPGRRGPFRAACDGFVAAMRRGNIQIRLTYIVATLIVVLIVEVLSSRKQTPAQALPDVPITPATQPIVQVSSGGVQP